MGVILGVIFGVILPRVEGPLTGCEGSLLGGSGFRCSGCSRSEVSVETVLAPDSTHEREGNKL